MPGGTTFLEGSGTEGERSLDEGSSCRERPASLPTARALLTPNATSQNRRGKGGKGGGGRGKGQTSASASQARPSPASTSQQHTGKRKGADEEKSLYIKGLPLHRSTTDLLGEVISACTDRQLPTPSSATMQGDVGVLYFSSRKEARALFRSSGQMLEIFGAGYKLLLEKEDSKRVKRVSNPRLWVTCSWKAKNDFMAFASLFGIVNSAYVTEDGAFAVSFRHHGSCMLLRDYPAKKKYLSGSTEAPEIQFLEDLPDEWDSTTVVPGTISSRFATSLMIRCTGTFIADTVKKEVEEALVKYFFHGTRPVFQASEGRDDSIDIVFASKEAASNFVSCYMPGDEFTCLHPRGELTFSTSTTTERTKQTMATIATFPPEYMVHSFSHWFGASSPQNNRRSDWVHPFFQCPKWYEHAEVCLLHEESRSSNLPAISQSRSDRPTILLVQTASHLEVFWAARPGMLLAPAHKRDIELPDKSTASSLPFYSFLATPILSDTAATKGNNTRDPFFVRPTALWQLIKHLANYSWIAKQNFGDCLTMGGTGQLRNAVNIASELHAWIRTGNVVTTTWADSRLIYLHKNHMEEVYGYLNRWFGEEGKRVQVVQVTTDYMILEVAQPSDPLNLLPFGIFRAARECHLYILTRPLQDEAKVGGEEDQLDADATAGTQPDIMHSDTVLVGTSLTHLTIIALQLQESGWELRLEEATTTLSATAVRWPSQDKPTTAMQNCRKLPLSWRQLLSHQTLRQL